ncbi:tandem-95 repeat protein [Shewanella sedimentimangrovi]|uniref:Tandem-95 repeat protein n=1 Tax=Shewanella sedimentimangrovi TaxID=2814293 RepID=A0ABX7R0B8_9GAMM|nr:tandem-95 repeat protein [Shewanella sedimentimangrovi]QSX37218.1 tandem-95 repeat protein [Shewanella sedimentimangrovi]
MAANRVIYRPNQDFCGTDAFVITTFVNSDPDSGRGSGVNLEQLNVAVSVNCVNDTPSIAWISNQSTNEDVTKTVNFTVSDVETAATSLTVTRSSSNTSLLPLANVVLGGSGGSRSVTLTPAANQSGSSTVTLTVSDGNTSSSRSFVLTVNSVNDAPVMSVISAQSTIEDVARQVNFTISDVETATTSLILSAGSSNTSLLPVANIAFGGSGGSRSVTLTPAANQSGSSMVTLTVSDGTTTTSRNFQLTVNAVNDAPVISNITDQVTNEDVARQVNFTISDVETAATSLTVTRNSSNTSLLPLANVVLGGSGGSRSVTLTPAANQSGSSTVTLTVSDGLLTSTQTFVLTVNAVNDAPVMSVISAQSTNEDVAKLVNFTISDVETAATSLTVTRNSSNTSLLPLANVVLGGSGGSRSVTLTPAANQSGSSAVTLTVSDGLLTSTQTFVLTVNAVNDAPVISVITDQNTNEDVARLVNFTISDVETAATSLTVTRNSSNTSLLPLANVVLGGSGGSRSVTLTPAANQSGSSTVTLTVSDGLLTSTQTFVLTVNAVNDAPVMSVISAQSTNEDVAKLVNFTISDVETAATSLTVTRNSSNTSLLPLANVVLGGSGGSRSVTLTPAANQSGSSAVTLTVSDGLLTSTQTFVLTVNAVNDAPVISVITDQNTNEDVAKLVNFTISDVETAATSLTVTRNSSNTSLLPLANVVLGGSGGSRSVTLTPAANQSGSSTVTLTVSDGLLTSTQTFVLTVNAVNDAPVMSVISAQSTNEDVAKLVNFTISDVETAATSLTVTRNSSNTSLLPLANVVLGGSGGSRSVTLTPAANQSGSSTVTLTVSDGLLTSTQTFVLTVNAVNDAPVMSVISAQSTNEDVAKLVNFTISDVETAATSLTVTRNSSNTSLLPLANVVLGGSGGSRSVTLTPAANQSGSSAVTLTVSDGLLTSTQTFVLTVNAVNDAPVISVITDQNTNEDVARLVNFTISDVETAATSLTVTRNSSNTSLLPLANVVLGGSGGSRSVTLTPAANQSGSSTVTLTVSDGLLTSTQTFVLTVNAVNDAPVMSVISAQSTNEDVAKLVNFTISDVETAATSLTVTRNSSNTSLLPLANVVLGGSGGSRSVTLTPAANQSGSSAVTLTVSDGLLTSTQTFVLTVNAVNDAPVISVITDQNTNEDVAKLVNFTISDVETAATSLSLSAASDNTSLLPVANIAFGGSGGSRSVTLTPAANQSGSSTVDLTVSDGLLTSTQTFVLTVNAVDDVPSVSLNLPDDIYEGDAILVEAAASDIDSVVSKVEFSIDGGSWVSDTTSPYSYSFVGVEAGDHTISARAESNGLYSQTASVSVVVQKVVQLDIDDIADAGNSIPTAAATELVGEIQGNLIVDGGAASYAVPITLPPGRSGMQPAISLNYSSQAGEGIAGMGWSLSAYSSIARCSAIYDLNQSTKAPTLSSADLLCLNGSMLVAVPAPGGTTPGSYGFSGTYYKTERNNGQYVIQLGGNINQSSTYFELYDPDGKVHTLGDSANTQLIPSGVSVATEWLQSRSEDPFGNQIHYLYSESTVGNRYLSDIYYTGFQGTYGDRHVVFNYTDKAPEFSYHWGGKRIFNQQLKSIEIKIADTLKAVWKLTYETPDANALNDAATLEKLEYCDGSDDSNCLTSNFTWNHKVYDRHELTSHAADHIHDNDTVGYQLVNKGDYDGDGVADLHIPLEGTYLSSNGVKVGAYPHVSYALSHVDVNGDGVISYNEHSMNTLSGTIDYDGNGKDDIAYINDSLNIEIGSVDTETGAVSVLVDTGINAACFGSTLDLSVEVFCQSHLIDVNGDGSADLIVATNKSTSSGMHTITYKVYLNNPPSGGFSTTPNGSFNASAEDSLQPMDLDGDGVLDLVPGSFGTSLKWYKLGYDNSTGTVTVTEKNYTFNVNVNKVERTKPSRWVDLNGDGLPDVLTLNKVNSTDNFYTRYVAFNKGNGLFDTPVALTNFNTELAWTVDGGFIATDPSYDGPEGYVYENFIQFVDYNGDGRQDILYPDRYRRKYRYECWAWSTNEACDAVDGAYAPKFYSYDVWYWNVLITRPDGKSFDEVKLDVYGALATMSPMDVNGDGRMDLISGLGYEFDAVKRKWYYGSKSGTPADYPRGFVVFANDETQDTSISQIDTGLGTKAKLNYTQLKNVYQWNNDVKGYPYVYFSNTMRVVESLSTPDAVGGFSQSSFFYKDAKLHVAGRGFQGFASITETNKDADNKHTIVTTTEFEQEFPWSGMVKKRDVKSAGELISHYQVDSRYPSQEEYSVGQSWCFYPAATLMENYRLQATAFSSVSTIATQNDRCQPTQQQTKTSDATVTHTSTDNLVYTAPLPGWSVLENKTSTQTLVYGGHSLVADPLRGTSYTTKVETSLVYDSQGRLESSTTKGLGATPGTPITTSYSDYDLYGHATKTTVEDSEDSAKNRWTKVAYDADGYFPQQSFNGQWGLGVVASQQSFDALTGAVLTSTNVQGVTQTNVINFIGQILETSAAKGSTVVSPSVYSSSQWVTGEGNAVYKVITRSAGAPEQVNYYDGLKRLIRSETQGFSGTVVSEMSYDARGNLVSETTPTGDYGTQISKSFTEFDVLGRAKTKTFNDGMVSYVSTYHYGVDELADDPLTTVVEVSSRDYNFSVSRSYNALGQLLQTKDAKGGVGYFGYNAAGLPILVRDVLGNDITAVYDDLGRKAGFSDPNMGDWSFAYNQFGELSEQTDARGIKTSLVYDKLGRLTSKSSSLANRSWVYDTIVGNGLLYQANVSGHGRTFAYDTAGRPRQMTVTTGGLNFVERYAYDSKFGRMKAVQYASGETLAFRFDDNGFVLDDFQAFNNGSERLLRHVEDYNAFGAINQQRFGNGMVQQITRNNAGSPLTICTDSTGNCSNIGLQYLDYQYDSMGNLNYADNRVRQYREDYEYDELMRVKSSQKTVQGQSVPLVTYDYDAGGNIIQKDDYGSNFLYGNKDRSLGGNAGPNAIRQFIRDGVTYNFNYDANGNRLNGDGTVLSYDDENKPLRVERNGVVSEFSYDADGMRYKQVKTQGGNVTTTYYVGPVEREISTSATIDTSYLGDHSIVKKAISGSLGNQQPLTYVLRDRLGSVDTLVAGGSLSVLQYRGYDVFGRPMDLDASTLFNPNPLLTDWQGVKRGFTDHEHLQEQQLIHMNGRIYDFNVGRFLSVDPFLQMPENSQSANPYSYILNNPMSGTDPTGYRSVRSGGADSWRTNELLGDVRGTDFPSEEEFRRMNDWVKGAAHGFGLANGEKNDEKGESVTGNKSTKESDSSTNQSGAGGTPKPTDSDGWEYVGQTKGVDTYQTVYTPDNSDNGTSIGDVNDNIITPTGLTAGYIQNKTENTKRRWSDKYKNHGKIWDKARLIGNYAFLVGGVITAGTTVSDIVDMRNSGKSNEDMVLRGIDGIADIAAGAAAFAGPVGWGVAAAYYGADYLSGGNLTKFIYNKVVGRREDEYHATAGGAL